jgi:hypothetical protein
MDYLQRNVPGKESGDRAVQADRSKADEAADKSRIYGDARKSAPDEHCYKVKERRVQFDVERRLSPPLVYSEQELV